MRAELNGRSIAWDAQALALVTPQGGQRSERLRELASSIRFEDRQSGPRTWLCKATAVQASRRKVTDQLSRFRRRRASAAIDFDAVTADLGLLHLVDDRIREVDPASRLLLEVLDGLSRGAEVLVIDPGFSLGARDRRRVQALLRWVTIRDQTSVVFPAESTLELVDLADACVVCDEHSMDGPGPWLGVLGRALRSEWAEDFDLSFGMPAIVDYLDEEGRWLRVAVGEQLVYVPFQRLSPGQLGQVAVPATSVLLRSEPLPEARQTNQCEGVVERIDDLLGRRLVTVGIRGAETSVRASIRALVEPETARQMHLDVGAMVWSIFEPSAARWLL
ncbi:MAG: hypothetical protein AAF196_03290 [Planctomycetota bacterium]